MFSIYTFDTSSGNLVTSVTSWFAYHNFPTHPIIYSTMTTDSGRWGTDKSSYVCVCIVSFFFDDPIVVSSRIYYCCISSSMVCSFLTSKFSSTTGVSYFFLSLSLSPYSPSACNVPRVFVLGFFPCATWINYATYSCGFSSSILIELIYSISVVVISSTLTTLVVSSSGLLVLRVFRMNGLGCLNFGGAIFLTLGKIGYRSWLGPSKTIDYFHFVCSVAQKSQVFFIFLIVPFL